VSVRRAPRRLRRNVPEGMHVWFLEGRYDDHDFTGYILTKEDSRYWEVTDEAKNWSVGRTNSRGEVISPPHHPPVPWYRAARVEPGDERYPAYAEELIPGRVRIATWEWRIRPSETRPEYRSATEGGRYKSLLAGQFLGIVVNPKLLKPALAVMQHDSHVHILRMDRAGFPDEGNGSYQHGCYDDFSSAGYGWPCDVSGCVRVHTAQGVRTKGAAYGTALYTSLVLGAHLQIMPGEYESDCVSSGDIDGVGRSTEAQKWWRDNSPPFRNYAEAHKHEGDTDGGGDDGDEEWEQVAENEVDLVGQLGQHVVGRIVEPEEDADLDDLDLTEELKRFVLGKHVGDWDDEVTYVNTIRVDVAVKEDPHGDRHFKVVKAREINVDLRGSRPPESEHGSYGATGKYNILRYSAALRSGLIIAAAAPDTELCEVAPADLWKEILEDRIQIDEAYLEPILGLDVRDLPVESIHLLGVIAQEAGATNEQLAQLRLRWELGLDPNVAVRQLQLLPNQARSKATAALAEAAEAREKFGWSRWENDDD